MTDAGAYGITTAAAVNPQLEIWHSTIILPEGANTRGVNVDPDASGTTFASNPKLLLDNTQIRPYETAIGDVAYSDSQIAAIRTRSGSRGVNIKLYTDASTGAIVLQNGTKIEGFYYAVNVRGNDNSGARLSIEASGSVLDGRCAFNIWQANTTITAVGSTLIGRNCWTGTQERFGNVVFNEDAQYANNCSFTAKNSTIFKIYNNPQTPYNLQYALDVRTKNNTISLDASTQIIEVLSPRLNYFIMACHHTSNTYYYADNNFGGVMEGITITGKSGATVMPVLDNGAPVKAPYGSAYDQLKEEFASGGSIKLYEDITLTEGLTLPAGKTATLDLNGHTITASNGQGNNIIIRGALTLKDSGGNGKIVANKDYVDGGLTYSAGLIEVNGEDAVMTMESGTISAVRTAPVSNGQFGVTLANGGDFTMTGGKIEAGWYAVCGNGNYATQNSVISIEGGELVSTADYAIYLPQSGTTTIKNGKVNGAAGGIAIRRGTLNIEGGEILSTDEGDTGEWSDGTGGLGNAALVIGNNYGDCVINISGGTISSEENAALIEKASTSTTYTNTISVTGGTFSDPSVVTNYLAQNADVKVVLNKDYTGPGFGLYNTAHNGYGKGAKVSFDLNGYTWNVKDTPLFGSPGYETQYFHLEKETTVAFKNGKIQPADPASGRMMIQNYCELTLEKVTLIGGSACDYVVSNNNGSCVMNEATITASAGNCAFDVYSYGSYAGVTVTVNTGSVITGNVEFGGDNGKKNGKLFINGGTFNGDLVVTPEYVEDSRSNLVIKGGTFNGSGWSDYNAS